MVVDRVVKAEDEVRDIRVVDVVVFGNVRVVVGVGIRVVDRHAKVVLGIETVVVRTVVIDGIVIVCLSVCLGNG